MILTIIQINQFHWHVVDSQSFPLEVPGYTEISQKGAYSSSSVYSASDVADIVSYAGAVSDCSVLSGQCEDLKMFRSAASMLCLRSTLQDTPPSSPSPSLPKLREPGVDGQKALKIQVNESG